jgi:integrase
MTDIRWRVIMAGAPLGMADSVLDEFTAPDKTAALEELERRKREGFYPYGSIVVSALQHEQFQSEHFHTLLLRRPLWATVDTWLDGKTDLTHKTYKSSWAKLKAHMSDAGLTNASTLASLRTAKWDAIRGQFPSGANWNHLRRAVSRFLTVTLGDVYHPARRTILKRIERAAEHSRRVSLTSLEFWSLVEAATPAIQPGIVTLAVTGMRLAEYERARLEHLNAATRSVAVQGSKTKESTATVRVGASLWPWIEAGVPMVGKRTAFRNAFKDAAKAIKRPDLHLHDLRHCTAIFALQEGAPLNAVREHMRHAGAEMTLDYGKTDTGAVAALAVERALSVGMPLSLPHTPTKSSVHIQRASR